MPGNVEALQQGIKDSHRSLLETLTTQDTQIVESYGMWRSSTETVIISMAQEPKSFADQFNAYRIRTLQT